MARIAGVVAPGFPHHVAQRGNRRWRTFFHDEDYQTYIRLMGEWCFRLQVDVWAYCLMPNHTHLIMVPPSEESLRRAIGEAHRRYTRQVNFRERWRGHLEAYKWSSAKAHCEGQDDELVKVSPLLNFVGNWREFLLQTTASTEQMEKLRRHERTGRPLGGAEFVGKLEKTLGRVLHPKKRGPKQRTN